MLGSDDFPVEAKRQAGADLTAGARERALRDGVGNPLPLQQAAKATTSSTPVLAGGSSLTSAWTTPWELLDAASLMRGPAPSRARRGLGQRGTRRRARAMVDTRASRRQAA